VDVAETTRATGVAVGLDGGRLNLAALSELLGEAVAVDTPRQLANENSLDLLDGLFGSSRGSTSVRELDLLGGGLVVVLSLPFGGYTKKLT